MKILNVGGDDDYSVLNFEEHMGVEEAMKKIKAEKITNFSVEEEEYSFNVELLEFGDVDPKFVQFVYNEQDYDSSKHSNFFVVEEK